MKVGKKGPLAGSGPGDIFPDSRPLDGPAIKEAHFRLPDYCTVFQAELTEIKEACIYLEPHKDKNIIIWTESLSSIQALASITSRSISVNNCYNALQDIATHNNVTLRWVPAHTGIWGNEKADILAKAASRYY